MTETGFDLLYSPDYLPLEQPEQHSGDYEEDGLMYCGQCRTPRQHRLTMPGGKVKVVRVQCRCDRERDDRQRQQALREEFQIRMERMHQQDRVSDNSHLACRFATSEPVEEESRQVCLRYVENWEKMRSLNMGLLLYGTVGSGKTHMAGCVVSELLDRQVTATVTSFPRLLNLLQDSRDRQGLLDQLNRYELLVIDDLGTERDSAYALEQIYAIVDSRARAGKPLVITTNLTLQELKNPPSQPYARIYDRVLELCPIALKMTGQSRRVLRAREKRALAKEILGSPQRPS